MSGVYQYVIIIGAIERCFKGCYECLFMKTRFLKKNSHSAQFHYKIDEEFHRSKILIGFLTCKNNYFINYSVYKTSPRAVIEMSSLTCVPLQLCETWNTFWQNFCLVYVIKARKS